jgi:hypothetical protein
MTVHILNGPYTIFANLQGLKTTMNSQPSQAAAQCLRRRDLTETNNKKDEPP